MRKLSIMMFLLGLCGFVYAQNIQIKGTVTSATDSYPIIGASVVDKADKTNGTITDIDGNFTLTVKPGSEITFSYIGYQTLTLKAETSMTVIMHEDSEMLQEVVVTGYTTQRKADLTGSISVVSMDEIAKQNENNPMKAMQGRVPGMNITADGNPSGSTTIRIRGVGTLNNNDPLYIIDGVPTKGGMHELNGSDIESIQVLKDAASASIYGSRAANGVIIITTKKGKEGQLKINFDASVSASMYTNKLEVLNADYIRTARAKGLSEHVVIYKHAFRNTLIPLVTIIGGSLPGLFSGALITETLFSIPGIGYISYQSMVAGDIPFTMFYLSFMAVLTLASNLLTDILYGVVDPRVRIS